MSFLNENITIGNRRLVGQENTKVQVEKILRSGRLSHSYLITGPNGSGKAAFALAMAEVINGIDHLTDLEGSATSKKSSWFTHPDIHLFMPLPSKTDADELQNRLELLAKDPYEIVDFSLRPALNDAVSGKNRRAFYSIKYFHEEVRPKTVYKPNEGRRTVVILLGIDTMRKESANAFLKLLEEPSDDIIFLLTASKTDQLLPTIISRCQQIRLQPLSQEEIVSGLITYDNVNPEEASFLARVADGNYSITRFFDADTLKKTRDQSIDFLRYSYTQQVPELLKIIGNWNKKLNKENQIALCNTLENLLRDIMVYRETQNKKLVTNVDKLTVIQKFCDSMKDARLVEMIEHLQHLKGLLYQNVQFKLIFTALSFRYSHLLRGHNPVINEENSWKHLPAFSEI